jgi:60 kDa SS-A/Ro ribonucleoprotein
MLSLDVSGSMSCGTIAGLPGITPRVGSAAMSLVTANVEQEHLFMAFSHKLVPLNISPRQRLDDVVRSVSALPFGGTDCALPMVHALKERIPVDVFVVYTDSETWHGSIHPSQALVEYRQKMGINAKLIVVGMLANKFSIADPNDRGQLDIVGFDTAAPDLMRQFAIE